MRLTVLGQYAKGLVHYNQREFQPSSDADCLPPVILPPLDRYAYV
jgi:hypothetical protein